METCTCEPMLALLGCVTDVEDGYRAVPSLRYDTAATRVGQPWHAASSACEGELFTVRAAPMGDTPTTTSSSRPEETLGHLCCYYMPFWADGAPDRIELVEPFIRSIE